MTDRETMELAAKAAGYELSWPLDLPHLLNRHANGMMTMITPWNPLEDDGDAFRLGVRAGVLGSREVRHHKAVLMLCAGYDMFELERRAIVLAVADAQRTREAQ